MFFQRSWMSSITYCNRQQSFLLQERSDIVRMVHIELVTNSVTKINLMYYQDKSLLEPIVDIFVWSCNIIKIQEVKHFLILDLLS